MVANKVVRPEDVTQAKAAHFGAEVVNLSELQHRRRRHRRDPPAHREEVPRRAGLQARQQVTVALADPSDLDTIDSLTHLLHAEVELRVASEADIEAALSKYYAERSGGTLSTDPRLKEAIEDLTREHVEIEAAAADDGGGGRSGRAAHQAGQFDHH